MRSTFFAALILSLSAGCQLINAFTGDDASESAHDAVDAGSGSEVVPDGAPITAGESFTLHIGSASVVPGIPQPVLARIERAPEFDGEVVIAFSDLPADLTVKDVVIPSGASESTATIRCGV